MAGQKTIGATFIEPTIYYEVTGDPVPDCKGKYVFDGIFAGKKSYARIEGTFFISWYADWNDWIITDIKGSIISLVWRNQTHLITGTYSPGGEVEGEAFVTEKVV